MNIKEATNLWVNRDMSAIPLSVVEKLAKYNSYADIIEITPPSINDSVYIFDNNKYGYISGFAKDRNGNNIYIITLDNNKKISITNTEDFEVQRYDYFPM